MPDRFIGDCTMASERADGLRLRDARADEIDAMRDLLRRAFAEYADIMVPSSWAAFQEALHGAIAAAKRDPGVQRIFAERAGVLIGSVLLFPPDTNAYDGLAEGDDVPEVRLLAVAPEARGTGAGRALVEECIRRARRAGAAEIGLHTSQSMQTAMRLYAQLGFVRVPERDFRPDGAELVEAYRLPL